MKSYRIEIKPNKTQLQLIKNSCDVSRYAYNWMLGKKIDEYETLKALAKMYDLTKVPFDAVGLKALYDLSNKMGGSDK